MMQLVIIAIGVVIALIVIGIDIIKITHSDEYEIDFEKKHKGNFVNRFETNSFDFRNHID